MSEFFKVGVSVAGLGAVGAFVFWSLMRCMVPRTQGHSLNEKRTFILTIFSMILVFLALLSILAAYIQTQGSHSKKEYEESVKATHHSNLKMLNLAIDRSSGQQKEEIIECRDRLEGIQEDFLKAIKQEYYNEMSKNRSNYNKCIKNAKSKNENLKGLSEYYAS